jgi:hypothetical protein
MSLVRFGETSHDIELRLPKPRKALNAPITDRHHLFDLLWCPHVPIPLPQSDPPDVAP